MRAISDTVVTGGQLTRPRSGVITRPGGAAVLVAEDTVLHAAHRNPTPTLQHEAYLHDAFEQRCDAAPDDLAVDGADGASTFAELDRCANRLARHLLRGGSRPGDRIALLVDQPMDAYTAMLAVSKIHATFVPLDVGFPDERIGYILGDAGVGTLLTRRSTLGRVAIPTDRSRTVETVHLDEDAGSIAALAAHRLREIELPPAPPTPHARAAQGALAYIIYTSGSTGRPKGVAVEHRSIDNFVRVAAEVYGLGPGDRVYQGMTIAFDFSVEEIWVPWAAGATLVPKPAGETLLGRELSVYLARRGVTALCCVPTLLATLEDDLPSLGFLLVSGEACPQDLIARWHRPGRRFLNVYGPTEATVTATWTELHPGRAVTIGVPLPTYAVVVLDRDDPGRALPRGETGEIGLAGVGLATGYLNNEERTRQSFVPDFLGLDDIVANPSGRVYRTGDLGRITEHGEVEYQGRIDLQVKIRGYRIELTEIESIILQSPGVAAAAVDTHESGLGTTELVGYYTDRRDAAADPATILSTLRAELPPYMVPSYLERLGAIPMTTSDKVDRANLPAPTARRAGPDDAHVEPATDSERRLADALAVTLDVERVSATAHVFDELGVTSLLVARFTAALRTSTAGTGSTEGSVTLKDVYQHPTVRELANRLDTSSSARDAADTIVDPGAAEPHLPARASHLVTACAQAMLLVGGVVVVALLLRVVFGWLTTATSLPALAGRGALVTVGAFAGLCLLPIAAKWLLIGRWTAREIPLWSLAHFRFWLVKSLVRLSPLVVFVGTPLYAFHLRALGATIGRDVVLLSRVVPVATDLLSIGDDTVIRATSSFTGYRAESGRLRVGSVTIGSEVLVGERTVLDVDTRIGDGSQLAHSSALHPGASVPDGSSWHGSPAVPADHDLRPLPDRRTGPLRKIAFSATLLTAVLVPGAALLTGVVWALGRLPAWIAALATDGAPSPAVIGLAAGGVSLGIVALLLVLRLVAMVIVPRVLAPLVRPGTTHRLYGAAHLAQLAVTVTTNAPFLMLLFGDSSFVVGFLRSLGYRLTPVVQTGSNFGTQMLHDSPGLTRIGTGTMVSDGLRVANADWSSTSFHLGRVAVGEKNFLGNDIVFPAGAKVGDNCLLATKVLVPTTGPVRHDVGLLGSPAFTIPRSRPRDTELDLLDDPALVRRGLAAKNRHNALSIATVLLARALQFAVVLVLAGLAASAGTRFGVWAFVAALMVLVLVGLALPPLFERAATGFRRLRPRHCSIYDRGFWRHERLWKFYRTPLLPGSALQGLLLRLAGVRTGRRLFDDGCVVPEKGLVTLGDDVVLNERSVIQCHSLEDGLFTRDRTEIGSGSVLGVGAFVHYGVGVGAGGTVGADSFLMKGEQMAPGTTWAGNPAEPRQGGSW